jgi:hypothetical protein
MDAQIRLDWLYPLHIPQWGLVRANSLMTRSNTTGYSADTFGCNYVLWGFSGAKSKKSRTGIPKVIENASIDSKEGAPRPRSTMLRKSTEMSRSSANSSCVMPRVLRMDRSFFPNSFRNVATYRVWALGRFHNTEYYYGSVCEGCLCTDEVCTPVAYLIQSSRGAL